MATLSNKQTFIRWMYRYDYDRQIYPAAEIARIAARNAFNMSAIDAEAFVENQTNSFWNIIDECMRVDLERGIFPLFSPVDQSNLLLKCLTQATCASRREFQRVNAARRRAALLRGIDTLSYRAYEALPLALAKLLGAERTHLTAQGNEGGIDFFLLLRQPSTNHIFSSSTRPIRVVGQCKKYDTRVEVDRVKGFCQTLYDVHHNNPSVDRVIPSWFRTVRGPIIGWMIAHNGFQSGAEDRAKNHGIILSDSVDIAEALSACKSNGLPDKGTERWSKIRKMISDILLNC